MGLVMGATAIAIVISPWGKRSGGHFNPAITFTFYRLGKVEFWDAWLYVIAQFLGAIAGVTLARYVLRGALGNHAVRYAVTVPGMYGSSVAFVAELSIRKTTNGTIAIVRNTEFGLFHGSYKVQIDHQAIILRSQSGELQGTYDGATDTLSFSLIMDLLRQLY
jgi:hypothetical protein